MIVVDASVAVKWLVFEPGSPEAMALLRSREPPAAPGLVQIEVASALVRKVRTKQIARADGEAALQRWLVLLREGALIVGEADVDLPDAIELALTLDHAVADRLYLAMAQREGAPLISADRRFVQKAAQVYERTRLLEAPAH